MFSIYRYTVKDKFNMDATQDILYDKWHELKGQVRQQWGKLTDDDLTRLSGKTEELAGILQQRYGYGKAQAEIEINNWLRDRDQAHTKV
jgi:uncharacterized protein YjbJ (UPF0337 family)